MKYAIWNKQDDIITPIGEVLTAQQWMERYPVARLDRITVVCASGEINGGFFGTLGQMTAAYAEQGVDFSNAATDEEKLALIEDFERSVNLMNAGNGESSAEERIAAALEYQNLVSAPTVNSDDPDEE